MLCNVQFMLLEVFSFFFFKQKTAYEMRISDWSSDVCSSDLDGERGDLLGRLVRHVLDTHTAFGRNHKRNAPARTVDEQREVVLARNVDPVGHIDRKSVV